MSGCFITNYWNYFFSTPLRSYYNASGGMGLSLEHGCDLQQIIHRDIAAGNQRFLQADSNPSTYIPPHRPSLCVMQGEVAIVDGTELKLLIGSQDATTCVVAILACPVTALVWAAHLDSTLGHLDVQDLQSILQQMQQPQLFMVGGYCTERGQGPSTAQGFLQLLHSLDTRIQPLLCCVAEANTAPDGSPRCCQLVFDMQSWQPLPWLFEDRGPEVPRRFAAQHCSRNAGRTLIPIWDRQQQQLVLAPFDATMSSWQVMRYERLLAMPDKELLLYMSTSPDHEPAWFIQDMRNMLAWLVAAQDLSSPERKASTTTSRYRVSSSGTWQLLQQPAAVPATAAGVAVS